MPKQVPGPKHASVAIVVWDDAYTKGADYVMTASVNEYHGPAVMQTVGWVLQDDEKGVSIANERGMEEGEDYYRGYTFIPRALIKSVTPIKRARRKKSEVPDA